MNTKQRFAYPSPRRFFTSWLLVLMLSTSLPAFSATLFSTLGQSQGGGFNFSSGIIASDFRTGTGTSTVTGLTLALTRLFNPDVVTASIYTDVSSLPGASLGSFSSITVPGGLSFVTANYTASTAGISLAANTNYWLVLTRNTSIGVPSNTANGVDGGSVFNTVSATQWKQSFDGGSSWSNSSSGNFIYSLDGTVVVPEPSRALLLLGGLGMMACRRRRV